MNFYRVVDSNGKIVSDLYKNIGPAKAACTQFNKHVFPKEDYTIQEVEAVPRKAWKKVDGEWVELKGVAKLLYV